ncbi:MAG: DUF2029 domain-containing protein [Gemmatales bacterium]|nr:DUF2029 domain-containing protein [Gemmatales bacterium]MDW8388405.1 glycosyltransferase family 87 protein [Gemmatales bacterium]
MDALALPQKKAATFRGIVLAALCLILLAVGVQYALKASADRSAFVRWRNQIEDLGRGVDIYAVHIYPNPPIMALILYPFVQLPTWTFGSFDLDWGALAWFTLKVVMTALAFFWTVRMIEVPQRSFPPWAQVLLLVLALRPIIGDLSHGNVNLFIMFLVVAALYAFHRHLDLTAGIVLGLAIACKVTPALFVPYFLWKGAWRTVAGTVVGLLLFLVIVPGAILGFRHNLILLNSWYEKMAAPYLYGGQVTTEHSNQSLPGLIYRLTTASPSFLDEEDLPADYHNLLDLEPWMARRILQACGIAFLLLIAWTCRTPLAQRSGWPMAAEFGVVILGMLLFSERTWKHHCVTLLVPFAVLCYCLAWQWQSVWWRGYLVTTLLVSQLFMASTSTGLWDQIGYRTAAKLGQVYGGYVWAYVVLLAALAMLLKTVPAPILRAPTDRFPPSDDPARPA